jgi:hypothetical protein
VALIFNHDPVDFNHDALIFTHDALIFNHDAVISDHDAVTGFQRCQQSAIMLDHLIAALQLRSPPPVLQPPVLPDQPEDVANFKCHECVQGGETVLEEWEIWGDPREIERRKADRKRANLPLAQRRVQLAEEWLRSKTEAATAKAAADKPRQKVAGLVIRDLKIEMKQLGTHACSNLAN